MNGEIIASAVFGVLLGFSVLRLTDMFAELTVMSAKNRYARKFANNLGELFTEIVRSELNARNSSKKAKTTSKKTQSSRSKKSVQATKKGV